MSPRYAIYYTPPADAPLTIAAASFLGRDAFGRAVEPRDPLTELEALDVDALTADPRGYGFHATLKAPFELAAGCSEPQLAQALESLGQTAAPFTGSIAVATIGPFVAFRLTEPSAAMQALHEACVRQFEPFRAPLSDFDLARRRRPGLTPTQDQRLVAFGYPYIFEDFRFHMTLTGPVQDDDTREAIIRALSGRFAPYVGVHRFDSLAVFKQPTREAPFHVLATAPLTG